MNSPLNTSLNTLVNPTFSSLSPSALTSPPPNIATLDGSADGSAKSFLNNSASDTASWEQTIKDLRRGEPTYEGGGSALFRSKPPAGNPIPAQTVVPGVQGTPSLTNASASTEETTKESQEVLNEKKALLEAAESFEALLVYQMFKAMEQNLAGDELIEENHAGKIFKDFLTSERSLIAVRNHQGGLGLARMIYEENVKHIEHNANTRNIK